MNEEHNIKEKILKKSYFFLSINSRNTQSVFFKSPLQYRFESNGIGNKSFYFLYQKVND